MNRQKKQRGVHLSSDRVAPQGAVISMEEVLGPGAVFDSQRELLNRADAVLDEAWEIPTTCRAVILAKKALSISPNCADAYNILALQAKSRAEALEFYHQGVLAGERALGRRPFRDWVGDFWSIRETRPYMRARGGLADCLWKLGQQEEALKHYQELLRLNPNDGLEVRYDLLSCLISSGRDSDARRLLRTYDSDATAWWLYSRALLGFRRYRASRSACRDLRKAMAGNGYVPSYLLGKLPIPQKLPCYDSCGSKAEAALYAKAARTSWEDTNGALDWLVATLARLSMEKRNGARIAGPAY